MITWLWFLHSEKFTELLLLDHKYIAFLPTQLVYKFFLKNLFFSLINLKSLIFIKSAGKSYDTM